MRKFALSSAAALAALTLTAPAQAAVFVVDAAANSSSGGVGKATISVISGNLFTLSSSLTDLWSAGALPRWSNGNGLVAPTFATGSDESGQPAGTQIGVNFGLHNQHSISAPFGSIVGEINGVYQLLGANFAGNAWGTGTLNLYYWDSNNGDNSGSIAVDVNAVPEPSTWAMLILGFGLLGGLLRRKASPGRALAA